MTGTGNSKDTSPSKLRTIWFFLKPYKFHVAGLFVLALVIGVLETTAVATIYPIVSLGLNIESGQSNILFSAIDRIAAMLPVEDIFIAYCVFFLIIVSVVFVLRVINIRFSTGINADIVRKCKERLFEKQMKADYQHFLDEKQGGLVYITTIATGDVIHLLTSIARLLSEAVLMISIFVLLFSMLWQGTMVMVLLGVGYYFLTQHIAKKVSYATGVGRARTATEQNIILNEVINGIKQIKAFLMQSNWINNFQSSVREYYYHYKKSIIWSEIPGFSLWLLMFSSIGIIALILRVQNPAGFAPILPLFGTFAFALLRLLPPMSNLGKLRMDLMAALPNAELVHSALNKQVTTIQDGDRELVSFSSDIRLDNVSFAHKGRKTTIKDVSMTLEKGKTTAIVGPSGAGKTTIADLLLRLFDPDEGEIEIDGVNLKEYKLSSWLSRVGLVSQDTFIFHDSIRNNIAFGADRYSDEEIVWAAKSANAHNFIVEFPQGYDTVVGERGMKLSGGQKQRIAIARAIIRKPDVLILDEATSALDNVSEALVQEAIEKISKERTVIVIAHRLSTIINADKIVVVEKGRAMEEGTHSDLMAKRGAYWNLYRSQGNTQS